MKYIVMECHFSYAVLLDENGKFLKAANRNYRVGQTVTDPVLVGDYDYHHRPPVFRIICRLIGLLALILLIFFGIRYCIYDGGNPSLPGEDSQSATAHSITADRAKEIALTHAELSADSITFVSVDLDEEDGKALYELEFTCNGIEYEYEIDAESGKILKFKSEPVN